MHLFSQVKLVFPSIRVDTCPLNVFNIDIGTHIFKCRRDELPNLVRNNRVDAIMNNLINTDCQKSKNKDELAH